MSDNDVQIVDVRRSHTDYIKQQIAYQTEQFLSYLTKGNDNPLAVVDIDEVVERYRKWNQLFHRVELFYGNLVLFAYSFFLYPKAVKCNNDPLIVKLLARLGSSFDCASKDEIEQVLEQGVDPSRIIFANPCKLNSHLTYSKYHNVDLVTFDSEEELIKVMMLYGSARLLLRFKPDHMHKVTFDMGKKFGCALHDAKELFVSAKKKGLNIIGVSFHVGSNCYNAEAYSSAIKKARKIFDIGLQVGFEMNILDIGGGFPGRNTHKPTIEEVSVIINQCLKEYFPDAEDLRIIAEPGRYLVETAVSAGSWIIGRKLIYDFDEDSNNDIIQSVMYTFNDGIYGTFGWMFYEAESFVISSLLQKRETAKCRSIVWGPSCSATDCVVTHVELPQMEVGEWVHISYSGAYSFCLSTNFNSMPRSKLYYFCTRDTWYAMLVLL
ncbi:Ornithine decarboxylase [Mizuhopecten yessoensis]|uniref:Ornithine decarboxylase n=1 Tax=Mizuhopecten yessoensis TaxID=6573 RepID=A0A210QIY8_MIZYE|nr:Ornithine decarboxylase [Mizuhopecten yessoensis]